MQYSMVAVAALVAGASAHYNASISYTTEIVDSFTTFCPGATKITQGASVFTITEATTFTITNCPCTLTKPVVSAVPTIKVSSAAPVVPTPAAVTSVASAVPVTSVPVAPTPVASASSVVPIFANTTVPTVPSVGTSSPSSPVAPAVASTSAFKGAAGQLSAPAGLVGALAIAAFFL